MKRRNIMSAVIPLTIVLAIGGSIYIAKVQADKRVQRQQAMMDALLDKEFTRVFGCPLRDRGDGCKPR